MLFGCMKDLLYYPEYSKFRKRQEKFISKPFYPFISRRYKRPPSVRHFENVIIDFSLPTPVSIVFIILLHVSCDMRDRDN